MVGVGLFRTVGTAAVRVPDDELAAGKVEAGRLRGRLTEAWRTGWHASRGWHVASLLTFRERFLGAMVFVCQICAVWQLRR